MFDSAASILRGIAGSLNNACTESGMTANNAAEQGTNSSMSLDKGPCSLLPNITQM